MWTIYKHTNKINGKTYIGRTSQELKTRWQNGKGYSRQPKFYNAIQKYGWDNFEHEIISWVDCEELAIAEETFQKIKHNSIENGYNILLDESKSPLYGKHLPEETKKKISDANKGKQFWLGKHHTDESKDKISKTLTGKYVGENNPMYKVKRPDLSERNKMMKQNKGKTWKLVNGKRVWMEK